MLGLIVRSKDPTPSLISFLRDKLAISGLFRVGCQHVIQAAAVLKDRIFEIAPPVHILGMSRESLGVKGERVYQLSPFKSALDGAELT